MSLSQQYSHQEERSQTSPEHKTSDDRLLAVIQESTDVFWFLTPEGSMQETSPGWQTFTGQEACTSLGRGWLDAVHPADQPLLENALRQTVTIGQTEEMECHLRRSDGMYRLIHVRMIPVRTPEGATREIVVCGTDITRQELAGKMSDAQIQLAVNASGVGTWDWDLRTHQLVWTEQMKALFGLPPDAEVSEERFLAAVHPEDRERIGHINAQMRENAGEYRRNYRVIWPDGNVHWLSTRARCIADVSGKPLHIVGATVDITELKQAEEQITRTFDNITDAFVHVDPQWRLTYLNRQAERYLDGDRRGSEVLGQSFWEIAPSLLGTSIEHYLRDAMATLQTMDFDIVGPRRPRWFEVHVCPASDGLSIYFHDIDERKQAEEALRQSRDAFRLLTEAMPQLVWTARPDGYLEYANRRWYDYTGSTAKQTLGEGWVSSYHPDDQERVLTLWQTAVLTCQPFEVEARLCEGKTGTYRWFLVRGIPLRNIYEKVWKWLGTYTDIHAKKCTEEALRESEMRFRRLVQSNIIGITVIDLEGPILEANEAFLSMLEYTRQDLAAGQLNWRALTPPEYQERSTQAMTAVRTTGKAQLYEKEYLAKDGKRVPVLVGTILFRKAGSEQLAISFTLDLTSQKEVEKQREEARRQVTAILESITNSFVHVDPQWRYTYVNRRAEEYAGQSREEILGQRIWDIYPELLGTPIERQTREAMETQQMARFEAWHPHWQRWLEFHVYPGQDGLSVYSQDITERKHAEEQSQEAHRRITTILESITDAFSHVDKEWRYTYVNRALEKLMGKKREEIVGRSLWDMVPEVLGTPFEQTYREAMAARQPTHIEGFHPTFRRWLDIHLYPTPDGLSFYLQDITERKQAEEALLESKARFRGLVDANIIGIIVSDQTGTIREANEAFLTLVGYTQEDVAAGQMRWPEMTPPEYQVQHAQILEELLRTGKTQPFEKELVTKAGKRVPVLVGRTLFRQEEGSAPLVVGFVLDLTARKEIERQKDLMMSMTSHELKTPLAALRGTLQLIERRMKRAVSKEEHLSSTMSIFCEGLTKSVEDSLRQIDVQTTLINDLLDVSLITAETLKLDLEPCDLVSLVSDTVEDLRVTVPERSLLLEVPEHGEVQVLADPARISQVVTNYLTNAIRYSPADQPIHIGLTIQKDVARVWVRDHGPGLSKEEQEHLWQRFSQVRGVLVQCGSAAGLGLGLYICQTLIAQHQGEVGVESTPGEGSTFWFTLPLAT